MEGCGEELERETKGMGGWIVEGRGGEIWVWRMSGRQTERNKGNRLRGGGRKGIVEKMWRRTGNDVEKMWKGKQKERMDRWRWREREGMRRRSGKTQTEGKNR